MSIELPNGKTTVEEINEFVREKLGLAIVNCTKIEEQIAEAMSSIAADEAAMNAAITIENDAEPEAAAE